MPPDPVADLVVAQAHFALATVEAFFDAVFGLCNAGKFQDGSVGGSIRKVVIVLNRSIRLPFARDEQHFVRSRASFRSAGLDSPHRDIDREWSLLAIAHLDCRPRGLGKRCTPTINTLPRYFGMSSASRVLRRWNLGVAEHHVRGDRKQIAFVARPQCRTKQPASAHFVVTRDPAVWQQRTALVEHCERLLVPR